MKRKLLLIICILLLTFSISTSVFAAESAIISTTNNTKSHSFKTSWNEYVKKTSSTGSVHRLQYGFNTALINEDYAYANSNGFQHRSKIVNSNGTHYGPKKWANDGWSDKEVKHKGSTVKYYCNVFR